MPCLELAYNEFSEELDDKLQGRRAPMSVTIGLTDRCNLRCVHCFVHDPAQDRKVRARELTTEQWYDIFDKLTEAGTLWMAWTGGEILLRQDFAELYRYAKSRGFLLTLLTNGTLLTPAIVDLLTEWYPFAVEITLYGLSNEAYERVTGVRDGFDRVQQGIELLLEASVPIRLKTIAMTPTRHEVRAMYDFAADLGVEFRHDGVLFQTYHGKDIGELRLPPAELVALDSAFEDVDEDFQRLHERYADILGANPDYEEYVYTCGAGFRSFYVDPYGRMGPCQMTRPAVYDLAAGAFAEGWQVLGQIRTTRVSKEFDCLHCDLAGFCQRCPAFSMLEHGDPETVVEYACDITHLRARRLGLIGQASRQSSGASGLK